jgi:hypothetical protein
MCNTVIMHKLDTLHTGEPTLTRNGLAPYFEDLMEEIDSLSYCLKMGIESFSEKWHDQYKLLGVIRDWECLIDRYAMILRTLS